MYENTSQKAIEEKYNELMGFKTYHGCEEEEKQENSVEYDSEND